MTPLDAQTTCYGKKVSELQSGITIEGTTIKGTLNYVTGYKGFDSSKVSEQEGNYLALDFTTDEFPDTLTVEVVNGDSGPTTLTLEDHFCVFRIKDKNSQSIHVIGRNSGHADFDKTFDLKGLMCKFKS